MESIPSCVYHTKKPMPGRLEVQQNRLSWHIIWTWGPWLILHMEGTDKLFSHEFYSSICRSQATAHRNLIWYTNGSTSPPRVLDIIQIGHPGNQVTGYPTFKHLMLYQPMVCIFARLTSCHIPQLIRWTTLFQRIFDTEYACSFHF